MDTVHDHIWDAVNTHLARAPNHSQSSSSNSASCVSATDRVWLTPSAARARFPSRRRGSVATSMPPTSTRSRACSPGAPSHRRWLPESREQLKQDQKDLVSRVQAEIDRSASRPTERLASQGVPLLCGSPLPADGLDGTAASDPRGQQGLPRHRRTGARSDAQALRHSRSDGVSASELAAAEKGTVRSDGRGEPVLDPHVDGTDTGPRSRHCAATTVRPMEQSATACGYGKSMTSSHDRTIIFQERLYCIQWMRPKKKRKGDDYEFRAVTQTTFSASALSRLHRSAPRRLAGRAGCRTCASSRRPTRYKLHYSRARLDTLAPSVQPAPVTCGGLDRISSADARLKLALAQVLWNINRHAESMESGRWRWSTTNTYSTTKP